jgi:hypothetical protein
MSITHLLCSLALALHLHHAPPTVWVPVNTTEYDAYLGTVQKVMLDLDGNPPSFEAVRALMKTGHRYKYEPSAPYTTTPPEITENGEAGDCKAKALWLASRMNDPGVGFVLGKLRSDENVGHAWLLWEYQGKAWILDCTTGERPRRADSFPPDRYIPKYLFRDGGIFKPASPPQT